MIIDARPAHLVRFDVRAEVYSKPFNAVEHVFAVTSSFGDIENGGRSG
jgi:hypothetical protein